MARATNDLNAVRMLLGPAIMYSANTIVFTAGALAFMLSISPRLTFYAFLPLPMVSIVVQYFGGRFTNVSRESRRCFRKSRRAHRRTFPARA